jgi:excisionase family DNA binding protein
MNRSTPEVVASDGAANSCCPRGLATLDDVEDRVLITVSEAARRLETYPNAINRWIAKGELEALRVEGRGLRFVDAEQVEALGLALEGLAERATHSG